MEPWKKDPWFFCKQVVMETNRILMEIWRPHRDMEHFKRLWFFCKQVVVETNIYVCVCKGKNI